MRKLSVSTGNDTFSLPDAWPLCQFCDTDMATPCPRLGKGNCLHATDGKGKERICRDEPPSLPSFALFRQDNPAIHGEKWMCLEGLLALQDFDAV
jgi:hypothetical protein